MHSAVIRITPDVVKRLQFRQDHPPLSADNISSVKMIEAMQNPVHLVRLQEQHREKYAHLSVVNQANG